MLSIFIFLSHYCHDIRSPASLKKGTTAGCAKFGKTFFGKTRLPEIGTSARRIRHPTVHFGC
jgi:hypothetical protein